MGRSGWLTFSAMALIIAGIMRVIDAIWAFSYHGAIPDNLQGALLGHRRVVACSRSRASAGSSRTLPRRAYRRCGPPCPGSRWRRGVSMRSRTRGCPGIISAHGPVATSTRRRTRAGQLAANCWASPPPQEIPRTSACS
jgi:hypothetical protein